MQQRSCLLNSILGRIYRRFVRQGFSVRVLVTLVKPEKTREQHLFISAPANFTPMMLQWTTLKGCISTADVHKLTLNAVNTVQIWKTERAG